MSSEHYKYIQAACRCKHGQEFDDIDYSSFDQAPINDQSPDLDFSSFDMPTESLQPGDQIADVPENFLLENIQTFGESPEDLGQIIQEFIPEVSQIQATTYRQVDTSFDSILYLSTMGYNYAQWNLSWYRGRILYDICDVYNGRWFTLNGLLDDARTHAAGGSTPGNWKPHKPYTDKPAPIYAQTHVNCGCSLTCIKPRTIGEVPATAPGIPVSTNRQIVLEARRNLLSTLTDELVTAHTFLDIEKAQKLNFTPLPDTLARISEPEQPSIVRPVNDNAKKYQRNRHVTKWSPEYAQPIFDVNAYPIASDDFYSTQASYITQQKFAANSNMPMVVNTSIMYTSVAGLLTPIAKGYRGFILNRGKDTSNVYIVNLNKQMLLPNDILTELVLRPSKYAVNNMYGGVFIYVDGMLGITFKVYGDKNKSTYALAYIPELDCLTEVSEWTPLEQV